jgi:hypothetical protein
MADLTNHGLVGIRNAVSQIREHDVKRVDLGHDTTVYKVPSNNPNKYTIRIDMKFDESEEI